MNIKSEIKKLYQKLESKQDLDDSKSRDYTIYAMKDNYYYQGRAEAEMEIMKELKNILSKEKGRKNK